MKTCCLLILVFASIVAGCSPGQSKQNGPHESFGLIVTEFMAKAAKKTAEGLNITVTNQITADSKPAEPVTALIQVRKLSPGGVTRNERETGETIDVHFVYETGRWRCAKAHSKEVDGEKVVSEHSLEGPDIRLPNLFKWIGL